jgi:DNA-binding NtrC family response regulator
MPSGTGSSSPDGSLMVLVVDDHPQLRQTAVNLLHVLGHTTLQAHNAVEAENHVRARGGEIQVALLDMNLDGHCGAELAGRLERASPGLRVLMMSGYQPEDLGDPGLDGRPFLGKPFSANALEAALRRLVAPR